ncbi:hypothetical protein LOAG_07823 [Loa loa]|uniref:ADF-H domain-containing protein n=1 Tax=Loa loa TaxID=7209 RepID=A0A1I7VU06_LOALO|nr:hypothetical protein LOAG_07823 [Loa loa]EFO20667.1 hypothetical protein LOAG_07823 [Loa loa]
MEKHSDEFAETFEEGFEQTAKPSYSGAKVVWIANCEVRRARHRIFAVRFLVLGALNEECTQLTLKR